MLPELIVWPFLNNFPVLVRPAELLSLQRSLIGPNWVRQGGLSRTGRGGQSWRAGARHTPHAIRHRFHAGMFGPNTLVHACAMSGASAQWWQRASRGSPSPPVWNPSKGRLMKGLHYLFDWCLPHRPTTISPKHQHAVDAACAYCGTQKSRRFMEPAAF